MTYHQSSKVTDPVPEVRSDIRRKIVAGVKAKLGAALQSWGISPPSRIAVTYDIRSISYYVRVTFGMPPTAYVDWMVDEDGNMHKAVYEEIAEQLAADARVPIAEEL